MTDSLMLTIITYGAILYIGIWIGELIYNGCKWWRRRQLKKREYPYG